jgi:hypothetical protein
VRWTALPDGKFITTPQGFRWKLTSRSESLCEASPDDYTGHVSYIDNNLVRQYVDLHTGDLTRGQLAGL